MNWLWTLIGRLAARPSVRAPLVGYALNHPYDHIGDYMYRYWIVPFTWHLPFAIRIHHIARPDRDLYLHDHPWNWRSIILQGWYSEENVFGTFVEYHEGSTRAATAETLHRIDMVSEGGVWTLFITYKKRVKWGFLVGSPARKIYWRDWESQNYADEKVQHE